MFKQKLAYKQRYKNYSKSYYFYTHLEYILLICIAQIVGIYLIKHLVKQKNTKSYVAFRVVHSEVFVQSMNNASADTPL